MAVALGLALFSGCGSPTQPSPPAPTISCPMPVTQQTQAGQAIIVTYPAPLVSGGNQPVTTTCSPPSGSSFAVGTTVVTCTALDALHRTATCSLPVTVVNVPQITTTKFVAFGDSITFGALSPCLQSALFYTPAGRLLDLQLILASVDIATSYPTVLQTALAKRYGAQSPRVLNEGQGGEFVTDSRTATRFLQVLNDDAPEVVLLQEGANDVNFGSLDTIPAIIDELRALVRTAKGRGLAVFLGTLTPERPGSCRGTNPTLIPPVNDQIRAMAAMEGVVLVDLYQTFDGRIETLLGEDGLHPNVAGYEALAQTFFDSIRQQLETPAAHP